MAAPVAQRASQRVTSGTSIAISVSGLTPGNFLVVVGMLAAANPAGSFNAITDNGVGSAWQIDVNQARSSTNVGLLVASTIIGSTPPTTITVPWSQTTAGASFKVYEFSGVVPTSWRDVVGTVTAQAASTAAAAGTLVPTQTGDLIIGAFGVAAAQSGFTAGAGYTSFGSPLNAANDICAEYKVAGTLSETDGGTYAAAATTAGRGVLVSYKSGVSVTIVAPPATFTPTAVAPTLAGSHVFTWQEDFETGIYSNWFPGGSSGSIGPDTTAPKVGARSCLISGDPAWGLKSQPVSNFHVISFYIRMNTIPNGIELFSPMTAGVRFGIDDTTKKFGINFGTSQTFANLSSVTPVVGQWYRIEIRINASANPWVLDWMIDGVSQPQLTNAVAANNSADIYVGHATGFVSSINVNYDQILYSQTLADYPLSAVSASITAPPATFTASSVSPAVVLDNTIVAPPASFTASSVSPTLFIGTSNTVVAPPATFTASSVAPTPSVIATVVAPPATFTGSSVAPGILRDWLLSSPPATFTASAVAPPVSGSHHVTVSIFITSPPGVFTASSVAPLLGQSQTIVPPAGVFTGSSVAPTLIMTLLPAAAVWTATALAPGFGRLVAPNAATTTYTSVASAISFGNLTVAPPAVSTFTAVSGALSLGGSVAPAAALSSFSAVALILQVPNAIVTPAAVFSATAIPPAMSGAGAVAVPPATWTATSVAPSLSRIATVPAGVFTATVLVTDLPITIPVPFATWTAVGIPPTTSVGENIAVVAPIVTMSSADPTLLTGAGATLTPQAAILTATGVGPFIFLHSFYPSPPALSTFTASAPGILSGSGTLVTASAATASYAAAAPAIVIPGGITTTPVLLTMSAPSPSLSISKSVTVPVSISTFSTVSPVINTGTVVGAPVAAWLATDSPPSVAMRLDAPAGIVSFSASAPTAGAFQFVIASIPQVTFKATAPQVIGSSVGTEFQYTQGTVWRHSMTSGDLSLPQTGRIVQTYERL
jgi:hypothetical protein